MKIDNLLKSLGTNNSSQIATAVLAGFKMIFLPLATATDKTASPEQKRYTITRDIIMEGLALVTYIGVTGQIQKHATAPICSKYYKVKAEKIEKGKITPVKKLTEDEIKFLKNIDSSKIKEAGNDFITQTSENHKKMSEETRIYIEKLNNIITKINGDSSNIPKPTLDDFVSNLNISNKSQKKSTSLFQDIKAAAKDSNKIFRPMKAFQNTRIALSQLSVWTLALAIIPPLCNAMIIPIMKSVNTTSKEQKINNNENKTTILNSTTQINNVKEKKEYTKTNNIFHNSMNTGMKV